MIRASSSCHYSYKPLNFFTEDEVHPSLLCVAILLTKSFSLYCHRGCRGINIIMVGYAHSLDYVIKGGLYGLENK